MDVVTTHHLEVIRVSPIDIKRPFMAPTMRRSMQEITKFSAREGLSQCC